MIPQVKALLAAREVKRAVIIDDAYDDRPRVGDIEDAKWDTFFDDIGVNEEEEKRLAAAYGTEEYERTDASTLRREPLFINAAWDQRTQLPTVAALFADFEKAQKTKRDELAPLQGLLETDLGLNCQVFGRDEAAAIAEADIIFLDLFLGFLETEEAINRAIEKIKGVVERRRDRPPSVVLLSRSPALKEKGTRLRDGAELLGCQFRMVKKDELVDLEKMAERIYELVVSYADFLKLNAFILAWKTAIESGAKRFLRSIRTLDLADYANLHALVLEAEGEPVGDYVLDLYDLHLHNVLEGDETLVRAAKVLNQVSWTNYPPAQFMPSNELIDMMDGALFQNETRTRVETEIDGLQSTVRLGDVFLGPQPAAAAQEGSAQPAAHRRAFVVLSQACDLKHGGAEQMLLMQGAARPYTASQHDRQHDRTPVMKCGDTKFSIRWDSVAPETWRLDSLNDRANSDTKRVRRFRTPFALQLQQEFIGNLGRVGTLTAVPARFDVGIRVFLRKADNTASLLLERAAADAAAAYLVGRDPQAKPREWLLVSEVVQDEFRKAFRNVPAADLPQGGNPAVVRDDPAFYLRFKAGVELDKNKNSKRPFSQTPHDIVQITTKKVCQVGTPVPQGFTAVLIIEVDLD